MAVLRKFSCVAAMDSKWGIGKNNDIPWHLPKEYKHFVKVTTTVSEEQKQNAVVMGRKTYFSIPDKFRPLKNRLNVVVSSTLKQSDLPENVVLVRTFDSAIETLSQDIYNDAVENIFVVGGAGIYKAAMESSLCDKLYITKVQGDFSADVSFPKFKENVFKEVQLENITTEVQEEKGIKYTFHVYSQEE